MIKLAPSILSADFAELGDQVAQAEAAGADQIHIDVMDGQFVPNITMGPLVVQAVRGSTSLPLDVHLMILEPDHMLAAFAAAGADLIQVHVEACAHLNRTLAAIRELGCRTGVVLNPATPLTAIEEVLDEVDVIMVMTVNPGFGGQQFIRSQLRKIERLRDLAAARNPGLEIEVDGGVHTKTAPLCVRAGADVLVAGSAIFNGHQSIADAIADLRAAIAAAENGTSPR